MKYSRGLTQVRAVDIHQYELQKPYILLQRYTNFDCGDTTCVLLLLDLLSCRQC